MSVILLIGAPGCGKSTVAAVLHQRLKCPWFEFGWIPEFRNLNPHLELSYEAEERLSLENLLLVTDNYLRHGFETVLLTDIRWEFTAQLQAHFGDKLRVVALYCDDDETIRHRVLTRDNGNEYRDAEAACAINRAIMAEMHALGALCIPCDSLTPEEIADRILTA